MESLSDLTSNDYYDSFSELENTIEEIKNAFLNNKFIVIIPYENFPPIQSNEFKEGIIKLLNDKYFKSNREFIINNGTDIFTDKNLKEDLQQLIRDVIKSEGRKRYLSIGSKKLTGLIPSQPGIAFLGDKIEYDIKIKDASSNLCNCFEKITKNREQFVYSEIHYLPDFLFYCFLHKFIRGNVNWNELKAFKIDEINQIFIEYSSFENITHPDLKKLYLNSIGVKDENLIEIAKSIGMGKEFFDIIHFENLERSQIISSIFDFNRFDITKNIRNDILFCLQRLALESIFMREPKIQLSDIITDSTSQKSLRMAFKTITGKEINMLNIGKSGAHIKDKIIELFALKSDKIVFQKTIKESILNRFNLEIEDIKKEKPRDYEKLLKKFTNLFKLCILILNICPNFRKKIAAEELFESDEYKDGLILLIRKNLIENTTSIDSFREIIIYANYFKKYFEEAKNLEVIDRKINNINSFSMNNEDLKEFYEKYWFETLRNPSGEDNEILKILAKKYLEFTDWIFENYKSSSLLKSYELWDNVFEDTKKVNIIFVIDAFGWIDGLHTKRLIEKDRKYNVKRMYPALSVIPTLTPCGISSLATSYRPDELGIFSYLIVDNNRKYKIMGQDDSFVDLKDIKNIFGNLKEKTSVQFIEPYSLINTPLTLIIESCSNVRKRPFKIDKNSIEKTKKNLLNSLLSCLKDLKIGRGSNNILIYIHSFDEIMHSLDAHLYEEYYLIQSNFILDILKRIDQVLRKDMMEFKNKIEIVITGDHGKFTFEECKIIKRILNEKNPSKKEIIDRLKKAGLKSFDLLSTSRGTFIYWYNDENNIQFKIKKYLDGLNNVQILIGDRFNKFYEKPVTSLLPPYLVILYKNSLGSDTRFGAHGGISLSEVIIPIVKIDM